MLTLVQFRKNPFSSAHEIKAFVSKFYEWGLDFSNVVLVNFASPYFKFSDYYPILEKSRAVITGGSGDYGFYDLEEKGKKADEFKVILQRSNKLFEFLLEKKIPSLHICFGHQLAGNFFGGKVKTGEEFEEVGVSKIKLTKDGKRDPLFFDIPGEFYASEGHHSAVVDLPSRVKLLAFSSKVLNQAFRVDNFWSVQFHPELDYKENIERDKMSPGYKAKEYPPVSQVSPYISKKIIFNFLDIVFGKR